MDATRRGRGPERRAGSFATIALTLLASAASVPPVRAEAPPASDPPVAPEPQTAAAAPSPPPPAEPGPRWSGLLYGDYYDVLRSHREGLAGQNGFWIRRLYVAFDLPLSEAFSTHLRVETNSKGDFRTTGTLDVYLKDAWLKWKHGAHALSFGLVPTPAIEFVDGLQRHRALEKSPIDLYRWDSSRDTGLLAQGKLGARRDTDYTLELGNGSGNGSETDSSKAVRAQLVHHFASGLVLEAYGDWQAHPAGRSWSTLEALLAWRRPVFFASLEYGHQRRRRAAGDGSDLALDFVSTLAAVKLRPNLELVGRLDRTFQPVPGSDTLDDFPLSDKARLVVGYAALDLSLNRHVHLIPNVELAAYDRAADGTRAATDVMPRATVFLSW